MDQWSDGGINPVRVEVRLPAATPIIPDARNTTKRRAAENDGHGKTTAGTGQILHFSSLIEAFDASDQTHNARDRLELSRAGFNARGLQNGIARAGP